MQLLEEYLHGIDRLEQSIADLTSEQMKMSPSVGDWTIHQIVVHLVDADMDYTGRMKRVIAEDKPLLSPFDQDAWALRLNYHEQDIQVYVQLFRLVRQTTGQLLRHLEPEAWDRCGIHPAAGEMTLRQLVEAIVEHVHVHVKRIETLRQNL